MNKYEEIDALVSKLGHKTHLERTKALHSLQNSLKIKPQWTTDSDLLHRLKQGIKSMTSSDEHEKIIGGLLSSTLIIPFNCDDDFFHSLIELCLKNLENTEVRVRIAVGECLGALSSKLGIIVYSQIGNHILNSIKTNFQRDDHNNNNNNEEDFLSSLLETSYEPIRPGTGEMRHGTEGWKCLETSFKALHHIILGCDSDFIPLITDELISLIYDSFSHKNRFIRETAYFIIGTVYDILSTEDDLVQNQYLNTVKYLSNGLCDDWSQVRYAASKATRSFMLKIGENRSIPIYPIILPPMCLNRYYVAEGVRLYSQESWRIIAKDRGPELVAKYAEHFVKHYIKQCSANNHAVREAACACISELMSKIEKKSIEQFVTPLLKSLVNCFKDASWPVRDAACIACGKCIKVFPNEALDCIEELYELWLAHLWDNIPSVRENSAIALGNTISVYGEKSLKKILPFLKETILEAKKQPKESQKYSKLTNTSKYGVAKDKYEDQVMFSCGSLAPKLAKGGGCMDHGFKRQKEPWEASDGCVYMVRELAIYQPDLSLEFIPMLLELCRIKEFNHCYHLHESVWKCMPMIAKSIGKKKFKVYLSDVLYYVMESVESKNQLERISAFNFLEFLDKFIGHTILKGYLSDDDKIKFENIKIKT